MKRLLRRYIDIARERNAQRRPRDYAVDSDQWVLVRADTVRVGDTIRMASIATARVTSVVPASLERDPWLRTAYTAMAGDVRDSIIVRGLVGTSKCVRVLDPDHLVEVIRA